MRLREDKHSANNFALAVGAPSIDTKVDEGELAAVTSNSA
jgi:hypothetical protein